MTDNKDPHITADAAIAIAYTNDIKKLMAKNKQQAAELKQLRAERGWQDISTAPRDGTKIVGINKRHPDQPVIIYWEVDRWYIPCTPPDPQRMLFPTHWMHLPLPDKLTDSAQRSVTTEESDILKQALIDSSEPVHKGRLAQPNQQQRKDSGD